MTKKDYNVDNYSESELFQLFGIDSKDTAIENLEKIDQFMKDFMTKNKEDNIHEFLQNAGSKILSNYISQAKSSSIRELVSLFQQNNQTILLENIKQHASYVIDTKEGYVKLYLENVFQILSEKIAQRQYEMTHENENEFIEQFVYLDTRFRSNLLQSSNNSIFDIPETKEVVSLGLHNIEVPLTWKVFDDEKQNNFFLVSGSIPQEQLTCDYRCNPRSYDDYDKFIIYDEDFGDSSENTIAEMIKTKLNDKPIQNSDGDKITFNIDMSQNKLRIDPSGTSIVHIVFHDPFSERFSKVNMNQTLGWKLGFRKPEIEIPYIEEDPKKGIAETYVNIYPNSLYLQVDDFVTHSSEAPVILPTPKYTMTNHDLTYCLQKYIQSEEIQSIVIESIQSKESINVYLTKILDFVKNKKTININHDNAVLKKEIENLLKSETKKPEIVNMLLDEVQQSIQNKNIQRIREPFAVIDLRGSPFDSIVAGKYLSEYHEDFEFKKSYAGPSSISKMKISIYDEQGELLDFQGCDFKLQMKLVKRRQPKSDKINFRDL